LHVCGSLYYLNFASVAFATYYKAQGMQLWYTDANALQHTRCGKIGAPAGQTILKSKWKVSEHTNDTKKYRAASIDNHEITLQFYKFSKFSVQDSAIMLIKGI